MYDNQMIKTFFLFILTATISLAVQDKSAEYSKDCKSWNHSSASNNKIENGFIKWGEERIFFDFKKKLWIHLGANSTIFYKQDGNMNILMGSHLISHQMQNKSNDTIANVILSMAEIGNKLARKDSQQWHIRSKDGRGEITFFLAPSEKCTHAPGASFISCRDNKCIIGPRVPNAKDVSQLCIKQLKLMSTEKTQNATAACKVFGDEKVYQFIFEESKKANRACGLSDSKLTSYAEIKSLCSDALGWFNAFK